MKRKFIALFISLILILSAVFSCLPAWAEEKAIVFEGSRKVELTIDRSDLNNYINGGQSFFDLILRNYAPEWLTFSMKAENRDIKVSLGFSFSSYEDYKNKLDELLGGSATVSCIREDDKLFLLEGFSAQEMLTFVYHPLSSAISYSEIKLNDLFKTGVNIISVNGKEYTGNDYLEILPKGEKLIKLSSLAVTTEVDNQGIFQRTLSAVPESKEDLDKLSSRFEKVGKAEENSGVVITSFNAASLNEANELTTACLYIACGTTQAEQQLKGVRVGVTQTESFGLGNLLSERGSFSYSYSYPDYYEKVKSENSEVVVDGSSITSKSATDIEYYYERDFAFSKMSVETDLTNPFGKIKKIIKLSVQSSRAKPYHEELKKAFAPYMNKGVTLNIYDEGSVRYYELSYSSFSQSSIDEFTRSILGTAGQCEISDSWLPFGKSKITESVGLFGVSAIDTPPSKISASYILPKLSKLKFVSGDSEYFYTEDNVLVCNIGSEEANVIEYHRFNLFKCIIVVIVLIALAGLVIFAIKGYKTLQKKLLEVKKQRDEKKQAEKKEEPKKEATEFCPNCGAKLEADSLFCENCGQKVV